LNKKDGRGHGSVKKKLAVIGIGLFFCIIFSACAKEEAQETPSFNSEEQAEIITMPLEGGGERTIMGDVVIDDIATEDYRMITTYQGDDVSVFYEDYATETATLTVNGELVETYDMKKEREKAKDF